MPRTGWALWVGCVALSVWLAPLSAAADARSKARRNFQRGLDRLEAKDYEGAITAFEAANAAIPHPDVMYNLARACADLGRYEEAIRWFEAYLDQPDAPADSKAIQSAIDTLKVRIARPLRLIEPKQPADPTGGDPPEGDEPSEPTQDPTPPTPAQHAPLESDSKRLAELADVLRPLSKERADEIAAIAKRIRNVARASPPEPAPTPKAEQRNEPSPKPAEKPAEVIAAPLSLSANRGAAAYEEPQVVTAVTKQASRPQDAPAVVWVITQREIRERGYETVAEALRSVAGLHVVDDQVFVDVGVRGLHAGLRGMSRLIKVLIDGHPVAFRPTSGNILGLAMIPIRAIDRIELIRGPGSALYGQNAFLGVLQVITRKGGDVRGGSVAGRLGLATNTENSAGRNAPKASGTGDVVLGTRGQNLSVLLTAQAGGLDRSGLRLPESSPLFDRLSEARGEVSAGDDAAPLSLFGSLSYEQARSFELSLRGGFQRLNARAEWLDFGPLTHFSEVELHNFWLGASVGLELSKDTGLFVFASYIRGSTGEGHQLRAVRVGAIEPDQSQHLLESFGSQTFFFGSELRLDGIPRLGLRIGVDVDLDFQQLSDAETVFDQDLGPRREGDRLPAPGAQQGEADLQNLGAYLQLSAQVVDWLDLLGGLRFDYHSLYRSSINGRVGSVFRLGDAWFVKVLYGSSFRAPAPDQLFHGSAYQGDTIGCENYEPCRAVGLKPQRAHTGELVLGVSVSEMLTVQATTYLSFVDDLIISFPNTGEFFVTTNAGSYLSKGLELEASARAPVLSRAISIRGFLSASLQDTSADIPESQFSPAETIRPEFRKAALFPGLMVSGGLDLAFPLLHLGLYLEGRYIGPRRASGSNLVLGSGGYTEENLPGHVEFDAHFSTRDLLLIEDRETVLSLRVSDVLASAGAEGGHRGWDLPPSGRQVYFRLIQEF